MALIIGGITSISVAAYALWKRYHRLSGVSETSTAARIRLGADLVVSVARSLSWVARLFSGEVFGPLKVGSESGSTVTPLRPPLRIGTRAGDLAGEETG